MNSTKTYLPKDFIHTTARCRLRIVSEADIPLVFSASRYPGFNNGMLWDPPASIEELKTPLEKSLQAWEQGTSYYFSIDAHSGEFLGRISIRGTDATNVWNIGFWTHPTQQGKGFMSEAAEAVIGIGFDTLNAERIEACYATWNKASKKVLEKIGMSFVKHIPEGFKKRGEWIAEDLMAIEKAHWMEIKGRPKKPA